MKGLEFFLITDTDQYMQGGAAGASTIATQDGIVNDNRLYLHLLKAGAQTQDYLQLRTALLMKRVMA